jgi:TfoX/Sxy family transcriptional regulator of competence genes
MTEDDVVRELRQALANAGTIREVRMFGGTGFMLNGNMVAGTFRQGLLLRVGKDRLAQALKLKGTRQMEMAGRLMEGYAYVEPTSLSRKAIDGLLPLAVAFVGTLPAKVKKTASPRKKR